MTFERWTLRKYIKLLRKTCTTFSLCYIKIRQRSLAKNMFVFDFDEKCAPETFSERTNEVVRHKVPRKVLLGTSYWVPFIIPNFFEFFQFFSCTRNSQRTTIGQNISWKHTANIIFICLSFSSKYSS